MYLAGLFALPVLVVGLAAIAVFLGHVYPIFLGFKGGKGVATALGVLFALQPWLALATVGTWMILAYASRYSSLASIRSEEHTSELQSLMRISYAVFCLKKKKTLITNR